MNIHFLIVSACSILLLSGCGDKSAIQKLQSNQISEELNNVFWGKELDGDSTLWHQAISYCKCHEDKPNCGPVLQLNIFNNGSTKIMPYGSSGNTLSVPDYSQDARN